MPNTEGMSWGSDVPISLPAPPADDIIVDYGAFGLTRYGIVHKINSVDLEDFIPSFLPGGSANNE